METAGVIDTGSLNGSIVRHSDGTYTVPTFTAKNLLGVQLDTQVTAVVEDARGNVLPQTAGKVTLPEYEGAQHITITYSAQGCVDATVTVNLQNADSDILMQASELGAALIDANGNTVEYSTEQKHGDDEGSIKISNIVSDETGVFLNKSEYSRYVEFYAYTAASGIKMGGWWCNDTVIAQNCWTKVIIDRQSQNYNAHGGEIVLRIFGNENVVKGKTVYISSVRTYDAPEQKSGTQLNSIETAVVYDGAAGLTMAELPATLDDENVKETSVLKVEAKGNDIQLSSLLTFDSDTSKYSEIYFWVYVESEQVEELKRVAGGSFWKDGGKIASTNTWTKISFDANLISQLDNGISTDLSKFKFRVYSQTWSVETEGQYTSISGKNIYVTSLYGVPKA